MTRKRKALIWSLGIVATGALALYSVENGIPFVEGDWVTRSGSAYGFRVGASRAEAFQVVHERYARPGHFIRVLWQRESPVNAKLGTFENVDSKQWTHEKYSYWRQPVSAVTELTPPLQLGDRWDIDLPGGWVNAIYLTFSGEHLVQVQRSRGLFERP